MFNYKSKKVTEVKQECVSITCDICKTKVPIKDCQESQEFLDLQEFLHVDFVGGFGSVFGDERWVQCDICQHCLKNLIGDYVRYPSDEDN